MRLARGAVLAALLAATLLAGAAPAPPLAPVDYSSIPRIAGWIRGAELAEFSGLAQSRRRAGRLWAINDGGSAPVLWALDRSGQVRGQVEVRGAPNTDWEDLASFQLRGKSYLMIADTGNNDGHRGALNLYFVREPRRAEGKVEVRWRVRLRYPQGSLDSESATVDAAGGWVYLVSKRIRPSLLFRVPLEPGNDRVQTAELLGSLGGIREPTPEQVRKGSNFLRYAAEPTALDLSCDGRTLALLTYSRIHFYQRPDAAASWTPVLAAPLASITLPPLPQAEALAWNRDCSALYVGSEQPPVPLLRYRTAR